MGEEQSHQYETIVPPGVKTPKLNFIHCVKNDTVMKAFAKKTYADSTKLLVD